MSNGEYAYVYDNAGNLIKKGNKYSIAGEVVTFTATSGDGVEYWEYKYNLQNRLAKVYKNEELIAEFTYDADDSRIKTVEYDYTGTATTTNFFYSVSGKVIFEDESGDYTSYIFALNKQYAKVNGIVGVSTEITYFHQDNLGSTRLMTDASAKVVMDQDYLPFGGDLAKPNQIEVQNDAGESYKYTGQKQVVSIGLYFYGARYYDREIGRFTREDSYRGELDQPQTQHLYIYVTNNPLRYTDPSGNSRRDPFHEFMTNVLWNGIQEIKSFNNPRTRAYFKGVGDSWVDTGKGVVDFARDPINNSITAAKSAYNTGKQAYGYVTSNSLGQIYQDGVDLATSKYNAFQQLSPEKKAYALGRGANNIGMDVLAGGAGAEVLDKVADAAKNSKLVNKFNNLDVEGANQFELYRRTKNTGEFSGLSEPMQLRHVKKTAKKAGIGLKGVKVKIVRDPDLMGRDLYGYAGGNRIQLYPDAFSSRENLVKTLGHERMHIYQESIFGKPKDTTTLNKFEKAAYGSEEMWWDHYLNNKGK